MSEPEVETEKVAAFAVGDRVAWSHAYATDHAMGSIVKTDVVGAKDPTATYGTVTAIANDEGTYFDVEFDDGEAMTLTEDELVKVADR